MISIRKGTLVIGLCLNLITTYAQEDSDTALWSSIGIEYEPTKNWNLGVEGNYRLKDNLSELDEYFGELTATRKIAKDLKLGSALRYIWENDNKGNIQGIENHIRYHLETIYQVKPGDFSTKFRLRYQNKNELGVDDTHTQRIRLKVGLGYNIGGWKLDPEISGELFSANLSNGGNLVKFYRLKIGTDYKMKNGGKIDFYYGFQRDLEKLGREILHIFALKYSFTFEGK